MADLQSDKQLRSQLRALQDNIKHNKHTLQGTENNQIVETLEGLNKLQQQVSKPREQALDSEIFKDLTEAGRDFVGKLARGGKSYTPADFIRRLKSHYVRALDAQRRGALDASALDWAALGRSVAAYFRPAPVTYHMLGPMDSRPREKRTVVRHKRKAPVGEAVRPEELKDAGDTEKQETDKNMDEMWGVLKKQGGRANLMALVLNHQSFSQTVENLFTLSFLVRDQRVELKENAEAGVEVVMHHREKQQQQKAKPGDGEKERVQFVVELDLDSWEAWREAVEPGSTLMRHRPEHHHHGGPQQQQGQQGGQLQRGGGDGEEEE